MAEDEMVGQYHGLSRHEFEQTPGDSGGHRKPGVLQSIGLQRAGHEQLLNNNKEGTSKVLSFTSVDCLSGTWD